MCHYEDLLQIKTLIADYTGGLIAKKDTKHVRSCNFQFLMIKR